MSDLRALIRELLSQEIAALRDEILSGPQVERVRLGTEAEVTDFARSIARRAREPGFVEALEAGRIRFAPEGAAHAPSPAPPPAAQPATLVTTVPAAVPELRKGLITERDIAAIAADEIRLRISRAARLTPLAADEVRRRGIRIERTLA